MDSQLFLFNNSDLSMPSARLGQTTGPAPSQVWALPSIISWICVVAASIDEAKSLA